MPPRNNITIIADIAHWQVLLEMGYCKGAQRAIAIQKLQALNAELKAYNTKEETEDENLPSKTRTGSN